MNHIFKQAGRKIVLLFIATIIVFMTTPIAILADENQAPIPGIDDSDDRNDARPGWNDGGSGSGDGHSDRVLDWDSLKGGSNSGNGSGTGGDGSNNTGTGGDGSNNTGTGGSGSNNTGTGGDGSNNTGSGGDGSNSTGSGGSGSNNTGSGGSGSNNTGTGGSGSNNTGTGGSGSNNTGTGGDGSNSTGSGGSGSNNTGYGGNGSDNNGLGGNGFNNSWIGGNGSDNNGLGGNGFNNNWIGGNGSDNNGLDGNGFNNSWIGGNGAGPGMVGNVFDLDARYGINNSGHSMYGDATLGLVSGVPGSSTYTNSLYMSGNALSAVSSTSSYGKATQNNRSNYDVFRDIVSTTTETAEVFVSLAQYGLTGKSSGADIVGIQNVAKTGPLKAIEPWVDNDYFGLGVGLTSTALSFTESAMNWRTEAAAAATTVKSGAIRSVGSYVTGAFKGTGKVASNVFSKVKSGSFWKTAGSKWKSIGKLGKTTAVLGAVGVGFDVVDTVVNIKSGDYVDAAGSALSAIGTGLATASLFAGPLAPALATAGLIVSGASLLIEHREAIGKLASKAWDGTKKLAKGAADTVSNVWNGAINGLGGLFS